ncbi:hypothetical protein DFH07DRAFT_1010091 [Mycena maculata]|uniref:Uncharacterized protein n=1 Tax=Mycena maculata TaxID=230809 RepID=A0AAD7KB43_9AGAR|nr:hypothetical protein DFH07DRAFT_1010091 [Mycena maculata]
MRLTGVCQAQYPSRLVRKVYGEKLRVHGAINPALEYTKKALAGEHRKQLNQPSRLRGRKQGRVDEMWECVVSASTLGSRGHSLETEEVEQQEGYTVTEKAATRYEVCLLDIARPGKQRARKKRKSMETPTISRVIDMEFTERWASESKLWVDTEDRDWDELSEGWEIPAGDYGEDGWEEVYIAGQECDHVPQKAYSAVLRGTEY